MATQREIRAVLAMAEKAGRAAADAAQPQLVRDIAAARESAFLEVLWHISGRKAAS